MPFDEVHSQVGESLRDSQIAETLLRSPSRRDGATCFIERYRGEMLSLTLLGEVCLRWLSGLFVLQRTGRLFRAELTVKKCNAASKRS